MEHGTSPGGGARPGVDRQPGAEAETEYYFTAVSNEADEAHVRASLVQALTRTGFQLHALHSRDSEAPGKVTVSAELSASTRDDSQLEQAVSRLSLEPGVSAVSWTVVGTEDEEYDEDNGSRRRARIRNWLPGPRRI